MNLQRMNLQQPRLTVLSGPSGVGKGTLVKALRMKYPQLWLSVSATTRLARQGEVDGIDYFFKSSAAFKALVASGCLLEWAEFAGNCYGTPRQPVEQRLAAGAPVLLEIELEGARQVRKSFPQAFQILLKPPSMAVLEARIRGRGTEQEGAIQRRLARAEQELKAEVEVDAVVENNELADALAQLELLMGFSQEQTTCPETND